MKKVLQSLNQRKTKGFLLKSYIKTSILIATLSLTACASGKQTSMVDFEPCSVADSVKPMSDSEFNAAFTACKARAMGGDPISQKNLAYIYYFGNAHVQKDAVEGARWFNAAAQQGNAAAIARVQDMGIGTQVGYNYYYAR